MMLGSIFSKIVTPVNSPTAIQLDTIDPYKRSSILDRANLTLCFSLSLSVPVQAGVITGAIIGVVLGLLILVVAIYYLMRFLVARRVFSLSMRSVWERLLPRARLDPLPGLDAHTDVHTHTLTKTQPRSPLALEKQAHKTSEARTGPLDRGGGQ